MPGEGLGEHTHRESGERKLTDVREVVLRRRLNNILAEWTEASDSKRSELIAEAILIWRDLRLLDSTPVQGQADACGLPVPFSSGGN